MGGWKVAPGHKLGQLQKLYTTVLVDTGLGSQDQPSDICSSCPSTEVVPANKIQ